MKSKRLLVPLLTTALTLNAGTAMATDMRVLESTPSKLLPKGQSLTLKSGHIYHGQKKLVLMKKQSVTVVLCDGTTVVLKDVKPKIPQSSQKGCQFNWFNSVLEDLDTTTVPTDDDNDTRGEGKSLWMVDVSTSATYCVRQEIDLWRPGLKEKLEETSLILTHQTTPLQSVTMTWPAKRSILLWPSKMPIEEGGIYTAKLGEGKANSLILHQLPSNIATNAQKMKWMAEKGCLSQARELFDTGDWEE